MDFQIWLEFLDKIVPSRFYRVTFSDYRCTSQTTLVLQGSTAQQEVILCGFFESQSNNTMQGNIWIWHLTSNHFFVIYSKITGFLCIWWNGYFKLFINSMPYPPFRHTGCLPGHYRTVKYPEVVLKEGLHVTG